MRKNLIFGVFFTSGIIALNSTSCTQQTKSAESSEKKEINGGDIYNHYCVSCHGKDGKMGVSGAKDLSISPLTLEEKISVISYGRGGMMPYKDLMSKEEIEAVAQFIKKLKK